MRVRSSIFVEREAPRRTSRDGVARFRVTVAVAASAACLALLIAGAARAQFAEPGIAGGDVAPMPGTSAGRPRFSVDATLQPGERGTEVRIDYRMERSELLFERAFGGYRGAYEVRVIFYKAKGGAQVTGDVFQRSLRLTSYSDTRLRGADIIDHVALPAPAGKYRIQVTITDLVAERASATEVEFEIPADSKQEVWFGDLSLGTASDSTGPGAELRERFTPVPARSFGLDLPSLAVLGEIVDSRPRPAGGGQETYRITMRVQNDLRESVWKGDTTIARAGERTPFLLRPRVKSLDAGGYRFLLELTSPQIVPPGKKKAVPVRRERDFRVEQTTENVAWELRSSLEVLRYVAEPSEESEMERIDGPDERKAYWERFWKRRDPTPETEQNEALDEFYRRVQYANQHFGAGVPGWRTDMGRIYIQQGAPDEVIRNPFNFDRPPEEIWHYYKERRAYVFVDRDGFGRYELTQIRNP
jgi:GWxTD domain-containing protein